MGKKRPVHLVRRGEIFYFRVALPRALSKRVGMAEWKASLHTKDADRARILCRVCSNAIENLISQIVLMPELTVPLIQSMLQEHFRECLKRASEVAHLLPLDERLDRDGEIVRYHEEQKALRSAIGARQYAPWVLVD
jgi:hypothetical protein